MSRACAFLALSVGSSLALQLTPRVSMPTRCAAVRMQQPQAADEATATTIAEPEGRVVPTAANAASDALMQRILAEKPELGMEFRRAEFWANGTVTMLEVINVLGRFESCEAFRVRTEFSVVENERQEDDAQAETEKRHQMALRMKCAERVSLYQNAPKLPFTDEKLAASVGLSVDDFNQLPVSKAACNTLYDALAESRSGLIPYDAIDSRRAAMVGSDGSFNEGAFRAGLYKSRGLIIMAWFLFGKGNFVWVLLAVKFLHDWRPDIVPSPVDMGLFKIGTFI